MKELTYNEKKYYIGGGVNLTGTLVNALKGYLGAVLSIGQTVGGAIRRIASNNLCRF